MKPKAKKNNFNHCYHKEIDDTLKELWEETKQSNVINGLINGLLFSVPLWGLIFLIVYLVRRFLR